MKRTRRAFTLIELLTVMAITGVVLTLITIPVVQSFSLFRQAQALSDAQDKGRLLIDRIGREIGNGASVRSSSGLITTLLNGAATSVARDGVIVQVIGRDGTIVDAALAHSKVDIIRPSEGDVTQSGGAYINPITGLIDPTMATSKGDVNLPLIPGPVWVRWVVALRDPLSEYNNPYDGRIMERNANRDNMYALYRIEFQPYVVRANKDGSGGVGYRPNLALFDSDLADRTILNDGLDDPRFMVPNRNALNQIITTDAKANRIRHWLGKNPDSVTTTDVPKAVLQTDLTRYDMIQVVLDDSRPPRPRYDGNVPRLFSLVTFRPTRVTNEVADAQAATRPGEESDNSGTVGSDVFRTQHPLWDNAVIRTWPLGWLGTDSTRNAYEVGRVADNAGAPGQPPGFSVYYYDPDSGLDDYVAGTELFDLSTYAAVNAKKDRFPFTQAVAAANVRSNWLSTASYRSVFTPYTYFSGPGKIVSSFAISEVGNVGVPVDLSNPDNLPTVGTGAALSVLTETNVGGTFGDSSHYGFINTMFNKLWRDYPSLQGSYLERFIDLRLVTGGDGTPSPLCPTFIPSQATDLPKSKIVPGSEQVYGPDQLPGPGYGQFVRYTRTTKRPIGPNQYLINYVDQIEPDYSILGLPASDLATFNANVYDKTNLVSAVIQPRFKKGYIALSADPNIAIPDGLFKISYRFQFTGRQSGPTTISNGNKSDVFAVDYDTRQLMSVLLTIRNYPQSSVPNPQNVTLKATATVRNFAR